MDTQGDRLRYFIEEVLLETPYSFAKEVLKLSEHKTIHNYCNNVTKISPKMLKKMTEAVSYFPQEWIMKGIGNPPEPGSGVLKEVKVNIEEELQKINAENDRLRSDITKITSNYDKYIDRLEREIERKDAEIDRLLKLLYSK